MGRPHHSALGFGGCANPYSSSSFLGMRTGCLTSGRLASSIRPAIARSDKVPARTGKSILGTIAEGTTGAFSQFLEDGILRMQQRAKSCRVQVMVMACAASVEDSNQSRELNLTRFCIAVGKSDDIIKTRRHKPFRD
jgi:hypothetical protein